MNDTTSMNVSRQTVSQRHQEIGLLERSLKKKLLVNAKNRKKRLSLQTSMLSGPMKNWATVFFRDENKFNLFSNNDNNFVRRRESEKISVKCTVVAIQDEPLPYGTIS